MLARFLLLLVCALPSISYAEKLFAGFEVGRGKLTVEPEYAINSRLTQENANVLVAQLGYEVLPNTTVRANYFWMGSYSFLSLSDDYKFKGLKLLLGYELKLGNVLSIVPEVGWTSWALEGDKGSYSSGDRNINIEGDDPIAQVSLNFAAGKNDIYLTYADNKYDFGKARSTVFGMKFNF